MPLAARQDTRNASFGSFSGNSQPKDTSWFSGAQL
jgi:hypothetical protein